MHIMTAPAIMPKYIAPSNPVANLLYALIRALNALLIKKVHMSSSKLKAAKLWPKLAEPQA